MIGGAGGTVGTPPRAGRHVERVAVPLGFFLLGRAVLVVAALAEGRNPFSESVIGFGDPGEYLSISRNGYTFLRCRANRRLFCGNAGWQPLYPTLTRVLHDAGFGSFAASILIASAAYLGVLGVLHHVLVERARLPFADAAWVMLVAAVFPGLVYFYTGYPISLLLLMLLVVFVLLTSGRIGPAGYATLAVAAFLAPITYSTGILLVPAVGGWLLWMRRRGRAAERLRPALVAAGSAVAGYGAFLLVLQVATGTWRAQLLVQRKYGNGVHDPVRVLLAQLTPTHDRTPHVVAGVGDPVVAVQAAVVLLLMAALAGIVTIHGRRLTDLDRLVFVSTVVFWVVPLVVGAEVSSYRSDALLLPSVLLLRFVPSRVVAGAAVVFLPVSAAVAAAVFAHRLM